MPESNRLFIIFFIVCLVILSAPSKTRLVGAEHKYVGPCGNCHGMHENLNSSPIDSVSSSFKIKTTPEFVQKMKTGRNQTDRVKRRAKSAPEKNKYER
jgi:hypothetical protein